MDTSRKYEAAQSKEGSMPPSKTEERIHRAARKVAKSGRHIGWWYVAHELRRGGEPLAVQVLEVEPIRSEINRICQASIDHTFPRGSCT